MALVSYDYSSGSDNDITDEEEEEPTNSRVILNGQKPSASIQQNESNEASSSDSGLFSQLPQVRSSITTPQISEENDQLEDFIPTVKTLKEKKKVQITIPSLSDFADLDDDEPVRKRLKPSQKGSGLLGILPPVQSVPMSNTMFVPNTLRKPNLPVKAATTSKAVISKTTTKATSKPATISKKRAAESDSDTDNEDIPVPDTFDEEMWEKVCGRSKPAKPKPVIEVDMTAQQPQYEEITSAPVPQKPYDGLDNEAFKELVGKSKRPIGKIQLIDINEDEILPDKDLWMTKSLTDPDLAPRTPIADPVDPTKKRKHHITYLAQQAKANEQELKSAWAAGKNNRMMSRSKYGF